MFGSKKMKNTCNSVSPFESRHIGPDVDDVSKMLSYLNVQSLDELIDQTVPKQIRLQEELTLPSALSEVEAINKLKGIAEANKLWRSFIGQGYYGTDTPAVILRNIFENPSWYTQYTPYQAEIAQGRLEALLNFQTMICDLSGLEIANSSLLDEGTALAEAMTMIWRVQKLTPNPVFAVHKDIHPQSLEVLQTRAEPLGIDLRMVSDVSEIEVINVDKRLQGVLLQNPLTDGGLIDISEWVTAANKEGASVVVAADLLSLCLFEAPGKLGVDIVVGSAQRFGVPLGYGGPHAGFMACKAKFQREIPGRIVGVSKDAHGKTAYRLALQTREQHIKRERATSNICTAQVLLAIISSMYAVYHGPKGLRNIAERVAKRANSLAQELRKNNLSLKCQDFFDTLTVLVGSDFGSIKKRAEELKINLRYYPDSSIGVSFDETSSQNDVLDLVYVFTGKKITQLECHDSIDSTKNLHIRKSDYLLHPVFNQFHSETEMLRYIKKLENRDLSLTHSMIPLGSCTMKLNATSEMIPVTWREFSALHPFVPESQAAGYKQVCMELSEYIAEITGLAAVSLQPNAGSQGEYAGLLVIRNYLQAKGQGHRNVCLIPSSAHGTNPASAHMVGMKVVVVSCDEQGNIDLDDLASKVKENKDLLAALMVTYPSTHGVFEEDIIKITSMIHEAGGYVYMDGANLNAQVGLCKASLIGADVCHLNLHKTFCIPHGGGGPGMGPIAAIEEFREYLPGHRVVNMAGSGAVSSAQYGSASILLISWMYITMMGAEGLTNATKVAILNANYIANKLSSEYRVLYKGSKGFVAHECILDLRHLKKTCGIDVTDIAKRLMDYGFHAPTVSFPVAETLMIEPTESESKAELDRFCEAMLAIAKEIKEVQNGNIAAEHSPLKNAPHTVDVLLEEEWNRPYSREKAVYPLTWIKDNKFWPYVGRIDNAYGDRNLFCQCLPISSYDE